MEKTSNEKILLFIYNIFLYIESLFFWLYHAFCYIL